MNRLVHPTLMVVGFVILTPASVWAARYWEGSLNVLPSIGWRWFQLAVFAGGIMAFVAMAAWLQDIPLPKTLVNGIFIPLMVVLVESVVLIFLREDEAPWLAYSATAGLAIGLFAAIVDQLVKVRLGGWR